MPAQRDRNESEKPTITLIAVSEPLRNSGVMRAGASGGFGASLIVRSVAGTRRALCPPYGSVSYSAATCTACVSLSTITGVEKNVISGSAP